jgi:hypothetical protein
MSARYYGLRISDHFNSDPIVTRELHPEKCHTVYGNVKMLNEKAVPMVVAAIVNYSGKREVIGAHFLYGSGYFSLYLPEGKYLLAVFADNNRDKKFTNDECVGYYRENQLLTVNEYNSNGGIIGGIDIFVNVKKPFELKGPFTFSLPAGFLEQPSSPAPPDSVRSLNDTLFSRTVSEKQRFRKPFPLSHPIH